MSELQFKLQNQNTSTSALPFEVADSTDLTTMIEFVFSDGVRESFVYGSLWGVKLIPDEGVEINFTGAEVIITGSLLNELYEQIRDRKVIRISEGQRTEEISLDSTPKAVIKKIDITHISSG